MAARAPREPAQRRVRHPPPPAPRGAPGAEGDRLRIRWTPTGAPDGRHQPRLTAAVHMHSNCLHHRCPSASSRRCPAGSSSTDAEPASLTAAAATVVAWAATATPSSIKPSRRPRPSSSGWGSLPPSRSLLHRRQQAVVSWRSVRTPGLCPKGFDRLRMH